MGTGPIIIDPNELKQFISHLKRFNSELEMSSSHLQSNFRQLGETWRDPAYAKFSQEFEQTMRNISRFRKICDDVIPRLSRTAERAEAVHN